MHFLDRKLLYLDWNITKVWFCSFNEKEISTGSSNGLIAIRHQPIEWINDVQVLRCLVASQGHNDFNTLRSRQNCYHFADDIFKGIFLNENVWISLKISLKFIPEGAVDNIAALVQIMAWRWPGAKPLSEPMMFSLLKHICVTQPQWVKKEICFPNGYYLEVFTKTS